jgi:hypothetical protein
VFLAIILLVVILYGLIQLPSVQTWLVAKVATNLSQKLQTRVSVKKVNFRFFNQLIVEGVLVEDRKRDTLLYAGSLKGNVTDWFIFKDKIAINNVELDNAIINMHRSDSVWNYQFILDYFASPKKSTGKKDDVNLDIKEAHFTNVYFKKKDEWIGQDMLVSLKKLDLTVDSVNFNTGRIAINQLFLDQPVFSQNDYEGKKPAMEDLTDVMQKIPIVSALKWNSSGWVISAKNISINNGTFINEKNTERPVYTDRFDGQHLNFGHINGSLKNILFLNDTLTTSISLSSKERSGFELQKLQSNVKFTPELMEFNDLELVTPNSKLGNYFSMQYKDFGEDFSSFLHNVVLQAEFKDSHLNTDDLGYFAPALNNWKRVFVLEGSAKGAVDNFSAKKMKIRSGSSYVDGDLSMRGLPDINSTFIDFKSNVLQTQYNDVVTFIPALKNVRTPSLAKLGQITYTGQFTGFINDFVAYGSMRTGLGDIAADLNMKLPEGRDPYYSGKIATKGFNLGAFINSRTLGTIALDGKITGNSFNIDRLKATVDGDIHRLDLGGYSYQNITINGDFEKKLFMGHFSINDPNLKISSLDGALNLSEKEISFNLEANVEKANLKNIRLMNENLAFSGNFSLNFTGNNIDNFLGTARVYNALLQHDSTRLSFDSLTVTSEMIGEQKKLSVQSNELDASITGKFKILQLPDAFKVFLGKYYPAYIELPKHTVDNQDFSFDIKTNDVEQYIKLFDKRLGGFNNSTLSGSLKLDSYELKVNANVPQFSYDGKVFENTVLTGTGNRDTLYADIAVADLAFSDSFHLPDSKLKLAAHDNVSLINLTTRATKTLNEAELNASVQTLTDGVKIHFFPSSFVLNNKKWQLEKDGELTLRKNYINASEVKFAHENEQIVISTEFPDEGGDAHLVANLKNVVIEDFTPFFVTKPKFKGILNGTATVKDPFGKTIINFKGAADSFQLDDSYIGKVNIDADANLPTGDVKFKVNAAEKDFDFAINGSINYKDTLSENRMNIDFLAKKFNISVLQPFLGTVFSKMSGDAESNLKIYGGAGKQYITGDATIKGGNLTIAYTQCHYHFDEQKIIFGKDVIDLGTMKLKDTFDNIGTVQGKLHHNFFQNFSFEGMRFETSKMLLLNTEKKDNSQFYGTVIGQALMTLNGPITNLQMNIDGEPSLRDSSHIYLPTGSSGRESSKIDYIEFIQFGTQMDADTRADQSANFVLNMNLTANPACKIDVILDEETKDIIHGAGNGKLNIKVGNKEPLRITGRYDITAGEYTFNFQTFVKKPFTLSQGSITWNGDPYEAIIDLDAEYLAKNVDITNLNSIAATNTTGLNGTQQKAVQKSDVIVVSHLAGSLKRPDISFEFKLPDNSEYNKDYLILKKLAEFEQDKNQMLNQVASLLLFNSFISTESFLTQQNTFSLATNTIGGVVSGWLTSTFNKELERATKGVISTYVDITPTFDLKQTAAQLQANVRSGLKLLLNSRLNVLIGGNLDYNNPYASQLNRKTLFTPDITVEWLLNRDGTIRVVGFNRTSIDITSGQRNRSGVQLSYRKDFNTFSDIFKRQKRVEVKDSVR